MFCHGAAASCARRGLLLRDKCRETAVARCDAGIMNGGDASNARCDGSVGGGWLGANMV